MIENWKPVVGYEWYEISDHGRLRRKSEPDFIHSQRKNNKGRVQYVLYFNGKTTNKQAHTLVLETFVGPRPEGMECRHLDGDHLNNHVSNLAWGTHDDNMKDKIKHGTNYNAAHRRRFSDDEIREIRKRYVKGQRGNGYTCIAREYGTALMTIKNIVTRKTYTDVDS